MLHNIDPILSPDLLYVLQAIGHGNEIVITDANFPAESNGTRCIRVDGLSAGVLPQAELSVMPLDGFSPDPAVAMRVVGDPDTVPEAIADFQAISKEVTNTAI